MNSKDFNEKLNTLLNEAAAAQIPLGTIVACLEISKINMINDQVAMMRQMEAMSMAKAMAENGTPKNVQPLIITPNN